MGRKIIKEKEIPRAFIDFGLQFQDKIDIFKMLKIQPQFDVKMSLIIELKLDEMKRKEILDIGAGAGLWAFLLTRLGHKVAITDIRDTRHITMIKIYDQGIEALGLRKEFDLTVRKQKATDLPQKYDLITSIGAGFYGNWKREDWSFFIQDAMNNLKEKGLLFLHLNSTGRAKAPFGILRNMPVANN